MSYRPEGYYINSEENITLTSSEEGLQKALENNIVLEGRAIICTGNHDLIVELPCGRGIIPRNEGAIGIKEGKTRDIALISRVNKPVCFIVTKIRLDNDGRVTAELSRRLAQEKCTNEYISKLQSGDVIDARVTHLEKFGCFVDIGCGISSLIPIDAISISRISHSADRFTVGQYIRAIVKSKDNDRIYLTHKELLGSWDENISDFNVGETVAGVVRSIENYGIFVELAPNLAGLAELKDDVQIGQNVSVYIKAIVPEKMKVKLIIIDTCEKIKSVDPIKYYYSGDHMDKWNYSSKASERIQQSVFS